MVHVVITYISGGVINEFDVYPDANGNFINQGVIGGCNRKFTFTPKFNGFTPYSGVWQLSGPFGYQDRRSYEYQVENDTYTEFNLNWLYAMRTCNLNLSGTMYELINGFLDTDNTDGGLKLRKEVYDADGNHVTWLDAEVVVDPITGQLTVPNSGTRPNYCGTLKLIASRGFRLKGYWDGGNVRTFLMPPTLSGSGIDFLFVRE